MNQSIETAQALVDYYQAQLELTPQYKLLQTAKKNLAELKDKEREEHKTISNEDKHSIPDSTYEFFCKE